MAAIALKPRAAVFKNQQSTNVHIAALCKQRLYSQALQVFDLIRSHALLPIHPSTYAHLAAACSALRSPDHARAVHQHILSSGLGADIVLNNHIVTMYGKCGSVEDARKVFDGMPERNVVSWGSMIAGYSQNRCEMDAIDLYVDMLRLGFEADRFVLANVIKACSGLGRIELGEGLHCHVVKCMVGFVPVVQNALIAMYANFGCIGGAVAAYEEMGDKDLVSLSSMIAAYSQLGRELDALCLFRELMASNVHCPNEFVFGSVFRACGALLELEYGRQLHGVHLKLGLGGDAFSGCSLCDMYAKCGSIESAKIAFCQIESPDLASWNAIISGLSSCKNAHEATFFFSKMCGLGLKPNYITISCLLSAYCSCLSFEEGRQVHSFIVKTGLSLNVQVGNALLTMYAKCSNLSNAFKIFKEMDGCADIVSWNALLTACTQHNQPYKVLQLVHRMQVSGTEFDQITLNITLCACAILATFDVGGQVHAYAIKVGLEFVVSVTNGLIDMYAKCGFLDDAKKLFKLIDNGDTISWSSLIVGYAQFGHAKEALELFNLMQASGIKPNAVTFVGVLTACSRFGLVDEGLQHFNNMITEHKILPTRELSSCVVDLLARAGCLEEAENFITRGLVEPDIVMWKTLLAACRAHKQVEIGKRAADNILKLDPSNSAAYVLLCSIFASIGHWDKVREMRKLMKRRGVEKTPGQSWIRADDFLHTFTVQDRSHAQSDMIYDTVQNLFLQICDVGYLPTRMFGANV